MNIKIILYVFGILLLIEGGLLMLPVIVALLYGEQDLLPILYSSAIAFTVGGLCWYFNRKCSNEIGKREGFFIVSAVWIVFAFFGAFPFMISGYISSVTDAFFEAISGFTTTGYTIIPEIEALPHGLLFWRSMMHFMGGIGILVLCISVLPNFGVGSMNIYQAETSAASGGKISPRIKDTAKHITVIYLILTLACFLMYLPDPKMNIFNALCHALSTTATGGFSTKTASMAAFSKYSQWVAILFMFLGSTSFVYIFYLWKHEFKKITRNDEFRFFVYIILATFIIVFIGLLHIDYEFERAFREGLFNVVNVISTTGFGINDYRWWTPPLWFVVFLLAFVGGCAGSTAGGLKSVRFLLLFRMIPVQFKKMIHQNAIIHVKLNGQNVSEDRMSRTLAYLMIFLCVYVVGVFVLMLCDFDFTSAVTTSVACLSNLGPGLELTYPTGNFANISTSGKWVSSLLMLLGRLELYSVLILFSITFWKKQ